MLETDRIIESNRASIIIVAFFAIVGVLYIFIKLITWVLSLWKYAIRSELDFIERYGRCWVVITGATDGVGKAFCESFAKRGFDICLISKTTEKLEYVSNELRNKYHIETKIIQADFTQADRLGFYEDIIDQLATLDVGILVNNVGLGYSLFEGDDLQRAKDVLVVNTFPVTFLTRLLLPKLLSREPKRSAIINLSSVAGLEAYPGLSIYSATKSYGRFLTICVEEEYKSKIDFLAIEPNVVTTPMAEPVKGDFWFRINPEDCSEASMKALGRDIETHGHWKHALQHWFLGFVPNTMFKARALVGGKKINKNYNRIKEEKLKKNDETMSETDISIDNDKEKDI